VLYQIVKFTLYSTHLCLFSVFHFRHRELSFSAQFLSRQWRQWRW